MQIKMIKEVSSYERILDDFVEAANKNSRFFNGLSVTIVKPKNDLNALIKGFNKLKIKIKKNDSLNILTVKDAVITTYTDEEKTFRAILYEYIDRQFIALYKQEKNNEYYFRIYPLNENK
ncbi:MAG: hypothetical protein JNJ41_13450 [Bacteroidia bacterium]|nr:hypothetical protein [Bacteroidia bacterium]